MEPRRGSGWLAVVLAVLGGAAAIVAAVLQFGSGITLTSAATGQTINPQPTVAFGGTDDWIALAAGVLMVLGAVALVAFRGVASGRVAAAIAGAGGLLGAVYGIKLGLDLAGSSDFPLQLQLTEETTGEVLTGVAEEGVGIGVWLLIGGAVVGLVAALMMLLASRRGPAVAVAPGGTPPPL